MADKPTAQFPPGEQLTSNPVGVRLGVVEAMPFGRPRPWGEHEFLVVPAAGDLVRLPSESPGDDDAVYKVLYIHHSTVPTAWRDTGSWRTAEPIAVVHVRCIGNER